VGGTNESVLKPDKKDEVLQPDAPVGGILQVKAHHSDVIVERMDGIPHQYQSIRQHISAGQVHLHDDENELKVSIPVADWYVIIRQLKTMTPYTYVDTYFNCMATFKPFINNGCFEVAIQLQPITVGDRFKQLASLR